MKKKKLYILLAIVFLVVLIFALAKGSKGGRLHQVTAEKAALRSITEIVSANGKIQPETEVKISSDVSGEIIEITVQEGDKVKKGQLLIRIRPDTYQSASERATASLNTTKANLANSKARLAQANAQFLTNELNYNRNKKLYEQQAISQAEFDNIQASYEVAKAEVEAAEQTVIAAEYNVQSALASLKEANENLTKTTIYAPIDGTVSSLSKKTGERVVGTNMMDGTEIMRIADLSKMEVSVNVNENDIVRISLNDTAIIEVDAFMGKPFLGIVTRLANSATVQGITTDQVTNFDVRIRILPSSYKELVNDTSISSPFRPGMSATADITTQTVKNAVTVPIQAVTTREDTTQKEVPLEKNKMKECVFISSEGKAKLVYVQTGIQDNKFIQVTSGLKEGEEVITGPFSIVSKLINHNDKIEIVKKEALATGIEIK
ncbi:MAG: biotin/lipoyl-binding protein [Bacteroidetes bacterium]|nr:biotin/lipoyl-binding protein [Bacteroidota bacterium]MBV6462216.1 Macrolide export protein MacA [Flavobacteriales bacterium]WKZ74801.1 MAG: efflux RND transporter periplasmic adaptor subunit [Vicingaceae bacterium]MCL4816022.1 efflux RND transporter periplasmic adaptor subunit [Flavobacteriales bacterium]NOG95180.1 biotin/lipoyl-binding protein [Bacteroidota bacterium]